MNKPKFYVSLCVLLLLAAGAFAGSTNVAVSDTNDVRLRQELSRRMTELEQARLADSAAKSLLEVQLSRLKSSDNLQKADLLEKLKAIDEKEQARKKASRARVDSLRKVLKGYPVVGVADDTLFSIFMRIGSLTPKERANAISHRVETLYNDDLLKLDSIRVEKSDAGLDIVYRDMIVMSVMEVDTLWYGQPMAVLANSFKEDIKHSIIKAREENSITRLFARMGLVVLVILFTYLVIIGVKKGVGWLLRYVEANKVKWVKSLTYKDYTFLSAEQEVKVIISLVKGGRWLLYILLLYIAIPIIFSIFPFSRDWADVLFGLVLSPLKKVMTAVWTFIPNVFSILVILLIMKYVVRFVHYTFKEIEAEKLKISGFHPDWALPTYSIVRILLYAFTFVIIFPYLPGHDSNIFKGVSVFVGILFSLGSSTAIANMVAGLVITYMRPFQVGDRIKIGDAVGDVLEKTMLVTRIKTVKNEVITIPNSSVLSSNTTNYSSQAKEEGLVIYTTITIGYDVPWREMHEVLIEAALRTEYVDKNPAPYVYQTSLEDFYAAYQINAYTRYPEKQGEIYSSLHQNIQDVCNEHGIEIMSPHYRANRDGNQSTIPASYLPDGYEAPSFKVKMERSVEDDG